MALKRSIMIAAINGDLTTPSGAARYVTLPGGRIVPIKHKTPIPPEQQTPAYRYNQLALRTLDNYWHTLSPAQHALWQQSAHAASRTPRSGLDQFRSVNTPRLALGLVPIPGPPVPAGNIRVPIKRGALWGPNAPPTPKWLNYRGTYLAPATDPTYEPDDPPFSTDPHCPPPYSIQHYRVDRTHNPGGTTDPVTPSELLPLQTTPTTAIPSPGYELSHWTDNGTYAGTSNPYTIRPIRQNRIVCAFFQALAPVCPTSCETYPNHWRVEFTPDHPTQICPTAGRPCSDFEGPYHLSRQPPPSACRWAGTNAHSIPLQLYCIGTSWYIDTGGPCLMARQPAHNMPPTIDPWENLGYCQGTIHVIPQPD